MSKFDKRFRLTKDSHVLADKDECGVFIMHETRHTSYDIFFDLDHEEAKKLRDALNYWYPKRKK